MLVCAGVYSHEHLVDEDEYDALTARPPGKRSSMKQYQNSDCATTSGSEIKHQTVRLGWVLRTQQCTRQNTQIASLTTQLSQTSLPSFIRITAGAAANYRCLSIKTSSLYSQEGWLTDGPRCSSLCHSSIMSVASRKYFVSLLSRSRTRPPQCL